MAKLFTRFTILIIIVAVGIALYQKYSSDGLTNRAAEYGKQNEIKIDKSAIKREEFKIKYNEAEWNLLQAKLNLTRYFNRLKNVPDFSFGFNPEYAKELATYWSKSFDWKKQIDRLNKYQQYRITINNTIIHYIYHETNRGKPVKQTINIMLIDGWPGCSFSFHKMIEKIENEFKDVSFKVIVPSIPGYGYSTPLNHVVDMVDTAIFFDAIMRYENVEEYFVHGEDWGCGITNLLAQLFPNRVRGIHITIPNVFNEFSSLIDLANYIFGLIFPSTYYTEKEIELKFPERYSISNRLSGLWSSLGYFHLQATKPDTVAHGITDSPVGLLAYVLEKYSSWTLNYEKQIVGKRDGGLGKFEKDDLLSIITIYWMTNSIGSSVRYYKINLGGIVTGIKNDIQSAKVSTQVRVGVQLMDNEILVTPESAARIKYPNLVQYNIVPDSGHFAAFEKPLETAKNFGQFVLNSL